MDNRIENIDWNAVWIENQQQNCQAGRGGGCARIWAEEKAARDYWERSKTGMSAKERMNDLLAFTKPSDRALDIGSGPGNLSIPLAEHVAQVTCVEPAEGMVKVLFENIQTRGIENISVIQKKWDDIDIQGDLNPPYQLCFASYSMGMLNLGETIAKMQAVTDGTVAIFWHAGDQPYDREAAVLYPLLQNRKFVPVPKSNIIFNYLYQIGIYPNVKHLQSEQNKLYATLDEAIETYSESYKVTSQDQKDKLREYLSQRLIPVDGGLMMKSVHNGMMMWWKVEKWK